MERKIEMKEINGNYKSFEEATADDKPIELPTVDAITKVLAEKPEIKESDEYKKLVMLREAARMGAKAPLSMVRELTNKVFKEAVGVGVWDAITLDAMNKRLLKGWANAQVSFRAMELVSSVVSATNFKDRNAFQLGSFADLEEVKPGERYPESIFSEQKISYEIKKYGRSFAVPFESMTDDDLQVLGNVVERFGASARRTLEKYILSTLIDSDPTIYDGVSLFDSSHNNDLGSGHALSYSNLASAIQKMKEQTDLDGNPLALEPRYLVVDPSNEITAREILRSTAKPGASNSGEYNALANALELIVSPFVTTGRWYVIADPRLFDTIELAFLNGRREPEVFQESANSGAEFEADIYRWKVRHVYGGAILDYRAFVRGMA